MIIKKINRKILFLFLMGNILAQVLLLIIPAKSQGDSPMELLALNITFVCLVSLASVLMLSITSHRKTDNTYHFVIGNGLFKKNVDLVTFLPIIGFFFLFYDRVFIRGIDYGRGLRAARYEWLDSTGGSWFSIVGNLIVPLAYIAIFFFIYFFDRLSRAQKLFLFLSVACGVLGHAALNGGRSNILLALIMLLFALSFKQRKLKIKYFFKPKILATLTVIFLYTGLIMQGSAGLGEDKIELKDLTILGIESLYGTASNSLYQSNYKDIVYQAIYSIAYLFHGQWTAEVAFSLPPEQREGSYVFSSIISVFLYNLGFLSNSLEAGFFSTTGAFISLPGAYYYDFGFIGVVICSIFHGIMLGGAMALIQSNKNLGLIKLSYIVFMFFLTIMSPILPAYGLSYLFFIMWGFILLWLINSLIFRKRFLI